jgi:hypothetical protein
MEKTSGRNFVVRFFPKSLAIGQKSSKTVIALEGKPSSAYPFRAFLLSLGLTYGQDITSKAISKLVNLPRQTKMSVQYFDNDISPTDSKSHFSLMEFKVEIVSLVFILVLFYSSSYIDVTSK